MADFSAVDKAAVLKEFYEHGCVHPEMIRSVEVHSGNYRGLETRVNLALRGTDTPVHIWLPSETRYALSSPSLNIESLDIKVTVPYAAIHVSTGAIVVISRENPDKYLLNVRIIMAHQPWGPDNRPIQVFTNPQASPNGEMFNLRNDDMQFPNSRTHQILHITGYGPIYFAVSNKDYKFTGEQIDFLQQAARIPFEKR